MKNKISSVKELCQFIWYLECKYNLLNLEIDDVKIWQYVRMEIYYSLAQQLKILDAQNSPQNSFSMIMKNSLNLIKNSIFYNPFFGIKKVDNIVFTHNRSKLIDAEYIDIYSKYFVDNLIRNNESYLCYEKPFHGSHIRDRDSNTFYTDLIISLSIMYGKLYTIKDKKNLDIIKKIENEIEEKLNIDFDLLDLCRKNIGRFKCSYRIYSYLFLKINPKKIYLVIGYSFLGDMIKAAKDLDIETIEFQHGVISKYHLGYSYPNKVNLEYYPVKFYSWGSFWKPPLLNLFKDENIINFGFPHFKKIKDRYDDVKKIENKIIIISQAVIGDLMMNETIKIIDSLSEYQIYYKLHPGEYSLYKKYKSYKNLSSCKNIYFLEDDDLYRHFSESSLQIGVFSTALYEGIEFGCKTFLYNLPGVEYMSFLIDSGCASLLTQPDDIYNYSASNIKMNLF